MVHMTPSDFPGLPVEQLAPFRLECAREDPGLLARSSDGRIIGRRAGIERDVGSSRGAAIGPSTAMGRSGGIQLPPAKPVEAPPLPLRLPASRSDPELEELVSIAVACARRAEDALQHAHEVTTAARRRMSMLAIVTGFGAIAASAAIALKTDGAILYPRPVPHLTDVSEAMHDASDVRRQTIAQLAEARSDVASLRDTATQSPTGSETKVVVAAAMRVPHAGPAAAIPATAGNEAPNELAARPPATDPRVEQAAAPDAPRPDPAAGLPDPARGKPSFSRPPPGAVQAASVQPGEAVTPATQAGPFAAAPPAGVTPVNPPAYARHPPRPRVSNETRVYRPVRYPRYYIPSPPVMFAQVVADVRRNLYAIFH